MKTHEPKVCIILVNYNNHKDTIECVKSLLEIEYSNYHIILVDNASTEENSICDDAFLKEKTILLKSDVNNGFSDGNNIAIKYAKAELKPDYYLLLNNDTVVDRQFLKELVNCSHEHADHAVIGGKIYYYYENNMLWYAGGSYSTDSGFAAHYGYKQIDDGSYNKNLNVSFITGCLMLIPREIIEHVGLLDEEYFLYSEDTDYCCRVKNAGYDLIYCAKSIIYHKVSAATGDNSPMQQYYMLRNDLYLISKYGTKKALAYLKRINNTRILISSKKLCWHSVIKAYTDFAFGRKGKML